MTQNSYEPQVDELKSRKLDLEHRIAMLSDELTRLIIERDALEAQDDAPHP